MPNDTSPAWKKSSYYDVYRNHQGYACHKWVHYPFIYDQIFARYLDAERPLRILEIGVQNGGSLEIWKKYLPPGSEIHGLDINPKCLELEFNAGIHFHLGSATDDALMNRLFAGMDFDVILDDGSHFCNDVISTFLNLFGKIRPGGTYIVEDLHTSYWEDFGGGLRNRDSSIEFFKQFIDTLHADYLAENQIPEGLDRRPFMAQFRQEIASVSFFDSICAVTRFAQEKQPLFSMIIGDVFKVVPVHADSFGKNIPKNQPQALEFARRMYATGLPDAQLASATMLLRHGIEAFDREDFEIAIECLSTSMRKEPDNPLPYAYLAFICARQGLVAEARDFIAQSTQLAPERADLLAALGEVFLGADKPIVAAEYLREAVHIQPDLFAAYPALAQSLHLAGHSEEAVSILQAAASAPSDAQAQIQDVLRQILDEGGDSSGATE